MAQLKSTNVTGNLSITGNVLASKIIKLGGTENEILLANGSTTTLSRLGAGTVTSVGLSAPTGFSVSNSPVTGSGTLTLSFATGYSLPTITKQSEWDTAVGWGDHSQAGYLTAHQDLSSYVTGPASATDNAIARFDSTTGKVIQNSNVAIDNSGNVLPTTAAVSELGSSSKIWKSAHIKAIHLGVGGQDTVTPNANAYGLGFWKPSFYTWYEYMAPNNATSPTGGKTPQYGDVTTYARRSLIESQPNYGWIWEACLNNKNATPEGIMALSSNTGSLKVKGSVTANGFKHSDPTTGNDNYILLAGGGTKALSYFAESSKYLPLAGGTMTGNLNLTHNTVALLTRTGDSWWTGIKSRIDGDEAVCFDAMNARTSWMFRTADPRSTATSWSDVTPILHIKRQRVAINKLIPNGGDAAYTLEVNGSVGGTSYTINNAATWQYNSSTDCIELVWA